MSEQKIREIISTVLDVLVTRKSTACLHKPPTCDGVCADCITSAILAAISQRGVEELPLVTGLPESLTYADEKKAAEAQRASDQALYDAALAEKDELIKTLMSRPISMTM